MNLWNPEAKRDVFPGAGEFIAGPYRGVLHTTEGIAYAGARSVYARANVAPHFTVGTEGLWQHVPINQASRALAHPAGTIDTNRLSAVQVEIVHRAAVVPWTDQLVRAVRDLMIWVEQQTGIQARSPKFHGPEAYGVTSPYRLTDKAWADFDGWCGHQHVPHNDHWDPGVAPMGLLLQRSAPVPSPAEVHGVKITTGLLGPVTLDANGHGVVSAPSPIDRLIFVGTRGPAPERDGYWPPVAWTVNDSGDHVQIALYGQPNQSGVMAYWKRLDEV